MLVRRPSGLSRPIASLNLEPTGPPDRTYKVVFAGDAAVGKTSFINRITKGLFVTNLSSTLGVDFQVKTIRVDERNIALQLWDTAGTNYLKKALKLWKVEWALLLLSTLINGQFHLACPRSRTIPVCDKKLFPTRGWSYASLRCHKWEVIPFRPAVDWGRRCNPRSHIIFWMCVINFRVFAGCFWETDSYNALWQQVRFAQWASGAGLPLRHYWSGWKSGQRALGYVSWNKFQRRRQRFRCTCSTLKVTCDFDSIRFDIIIGFYSTLGARVYLVCKLRLRQIRCYIYRSWR